MARLSCSLALRCVRINVCGNSFPGLYNRCAAVLRERHIRNQNLPPSWPSVTPQWLEMKSKRLAGKCWKTRGPITFFGLKLQPLFPLLPLSHSPRGEFDPSLHWCNEQRNQKSDIKDLHCSTNRALCKLSCSSKFSHYPSFSYSPAAWFNCSDWALVC